MAEKRMFSKKITESDVFLDMPLSAQALYFHLNMVADDDGFVNNPKTVQRMIGASTDDMKLLVAKNFIFVFESGITVIKHWRAHNHIQSDRYKKTEYIEEKEKLKIENNSYVLVEQKLNNLNTVCIQDVYELDTDCIQTGSKMDPDCIQNVSTDQTSLDQIRLDQDSLDQNSLKKTSIKQKTNKKNLEQENNACFNDFEVENVSEVNKDFAKTVFDVLVSHNLPCCNKNYISFLMRDFKLALQDIQSLRLSQKDIILATKNYASVMELRSKSKTWWKATLSFNNFVGGRNHPVLRFLPGTFDIKDYLLPKDNSQKKILDGKISL